MPFTTNLSGTTELADSIVQEYDAQFMLSLAEQGSVSQFATIRREIMAKAIEIPKYDHLALATSALTEADDVASEAMVDSKVTLTPLEYGNVVTTTRLANLQTNGKADLAAARLVGINAGRTDSKLAMLAMDGSSNVLFAGDATSQATIDAADVADGAFMNKAYNLLARNNVQGVAAGEFVMIAHDDVIFDLRDGTGAGTWQDVNKYALPGEVLRNEVGMYKGFRVIRNNDATLIADGGATTTDVYNVYFVGLNALGKAISQDISMVATGPYDKLNRFVNLGWYGVFNYGLVESSAMVLGKCASSIGANA